MRSLRSRFFRRWQRGDGQRGQGATEYMLAISVIVVAIVAAGVPFQKAMKTSVRSFGEKFETYFTASDKPDI